MSLTLEDLVTASGTYRERLKSIEYTDEVEENLKVLLERVNKLVDHFGCTNPVVTSGFRPSSVNSATPNAAKRSNHMLGKAVDLMDDKDQMWANWCLANLDKLEECELWMEDPSSTKGKNTNWVHFQSVAPKSGKRVFIP